jgi:hypothetical protein
MNLLFVNRISYVIMASMLVGCNNSSPKEEDDAELFEKMVILEEDLMEERSLDIGNSGRAIR